MSLVAKYSWDTIRIYGSIFRSSVLLFGWKTYTMKKRLGTKK